jgi:solute carrier family 25 phosphate transporter 23/24/25/41
MQEGVLSLYRGWLPSVIGVIPYVGLNFAVYETLKDVAMKRYNCSSDQDLSSTYRLAAGGVAGTVGQTIAYPFDVVRRRLQVNFPENDFFFSKTMCCASPHCVDVSH